MTRIKKIRNEHASLKYGTGSDMRILGQHMTLVLIAYAQKPLINDHADVSSVAKDLHFYR